MAYGCLARSRYLCALALALAATAGCGGGGGGMGSDGGGAKHKVGGTLSGLLGSGLVLEDNGGDDLAPSTDGGFTFATALDQGATYAVTVHLQPTAPAQVCTVVNGTGTVGAADVSSVSVTCSPLARYLLVADDGDDSVASYAIDAAT